MSDDVRPALPGTGPDLAVVPALDGGADSVDRAGGADVDSTLDVVLDLGRPNLARVHDLLLGGKNGLEADRVLVRQLLDVAPGIPGLLHANRHWLGLMVRTMVEQTRIGQFLDLGCGLPTEQNLHEVIHRSDPQATVVYVDHDPVVASHGQALLADDRTVHFVAADLTDPEAVLAATVGAGLLDPDRPVGVLLGLVLHRVPEQAKVRRILAGYLSALAPGSCLALTHPSNPGDGSRLAEFARTIEDVVRPAAGPLAFRTPAELAALVADLVPGLVVRPPGVASLAAWSPDETGLDPGPGRQLLLACLMHKP